MKLRPNDQLIGAALVSSKDDLLLVSRKGFSVRFAADDKTLRPMGRVAGGVIGMKFKTKEDQLLSLDVVEPKSFLVTATDAGFAKRTAVKEWSTKGRGTQGVLAMRLSDQRGTLVGAFVAKEADDVFAISSSGVVIRTAVSEIRATGRDTMGVSMMRLAKNEKVVAVAKAVD